MKKILREYAEHNEALMVHDYLQSQGIESQIEGVREYTSVVLGGEFGRYKIIINTNDYSHAHQLLSQKDLESQSNLDSLVSKDPRFFFRRSIAFAVSAVVFLPMIGNYISLRDGWQYAKMRKSRGSTYWYLFFLSTLQIPGIIIGLYILKAILEYFQIRIFEV